MVPTRLLPLGFCAFLAGSVLGAGAGSSAGTAGGTGAVGCADAGSAGSSSGIESNADSWSPGATASNSRQVSFTLVTEPEQLRRIADFTVGVFASTARKLLHPVVRTLLKPLRPDLYRYAARFAEIEREHEAGNDPILRRATALLIIHTPASNRFGCEDANLAYQNASLMAESLGVSQIYMGFVLTAARMGRKNAFARIAGITGRPQAIMALGIPAFRYSKYTER